MMSRMERLACDHVLFLAAQEMPSTRVSCGVATGESSSWLADEMWGCPRRADLFPDPWPCTPRLPFDITHSSARMMTEGALHLSPPQ